MTPGRGTPRAVTGPPSAFPRRAVSHLVARLPRVLSVNWDTIRLFLHVLAATIWVGGQITLAALVPVLRRLGAELPRAAARRFNQVAWPAFAVLVVTGIWNIAA